MAKEKTTLMEMEDANLLELFERYNLALKHTKECEHKVRCAHNFNDQFHEVMCFDCGLIKLVPKAAMTKLEAKKDVPKILTESRK